MTDHTRQEPFALDAAASAPAERPQPLRVPPALPGHQRDRALAPLFECYRALINLREPSESESEAADAVWLLIERVREAEFLA